MPEPDCPKNWDYEKHPNYLLRVPGRVAGVLVDLRRRRLDARTHARDTRAIHKRVFEELTPSGFDYFAGHYRGEPLRCLADLKVGIKQDPRVGAAPEGVSDLMEKLAGRIARGLDLLDAGDAGSAKAVPRGEQLLRAVRVGCLVFERFLLIHPFANGNGHAARFVLWAVLARYGFFPNRWTIDPRPADPPYTDLIVQYRNGNREPLERRILECVLAPAA